MKYESQGKSNHDRIGELDSQIKTLERDYEELKVNKEDVDKTFEQYQNDKTEEIDKLNDESKKDKDQDTRVIKDL